MDKQNKNILANSSKNLISLSLNNKDAEQYSTYAFWDSNRIIDFISNQAFFKPQKSVLLDLARDVSLGVKDLVTEIANLRVEIQRLNVSLEKKATSEEMIVFHKPSREEAKSRILEYIKKNPNCLTSDIIFALKIDPDFVLEILKDLEEEKLIGGITPKS